jgi:PKD repeat protein
VTLTVTDGVGQSSSTTQTVTAVDRSPTATFTFSCASNSCTFDASASTDDVGITSYLWDFGKLGTASGSVVKLTVRGKQSFLAMLTVRDGAGQASSTSQSVTTK